MPFNHLITGILILAPHIIFSANAPTMARKAMVVSANEISSEIGVEIIKEGGNAQAAVDAGRIHHQWLPDQLNYETQGFSPDTLRELEKRGHTLNERTNQGSAEVIIYNREADLLEGGVDRRVPDGGAIGW
ncbi:gamma-glutamyltransferase family protein [Opitutia bacterium ISCC 51]|nr:gamma-glutamyltransferase family protein [Opitutae bacterium ISCC 51]QXD27980.1 gamma-glutamyltransferase family protein [Opitutae bacterium ISCC 52]